MTFGSALEPRVGDPVGPLPIGEPFGNAHEPVDRLRAAAALILALPPILVRVLIAWMPERDIDFGILNAEGKWTEDGDERCDWVDPHPTHWAECPDLPGTR